LGFAIHIIALFNRHSFSIKKINLFMPPKPSLPEVSISDHGDIRYLHLGTPWVQGSMDTRKPFDIDLDYVQRMMAWLLFMPDLSPKSLAGRHAMQLGLGAAALTKFCYKRLRMNVTAVELNPQVLAVCRQWFKLPPDDNRLEVLLADAGKEVGQPRWQGRIDALQVDLYDHEAAAPVLDSSEFYTQCSQMLSDEGVMSVNLFGREASFERSLACIEQAFGPDCVWRFRPTREGNTIVLALRQAQTPDRATLVQRAQNIETRTGLPARKWLRILTAPS
jgi:spermidine synthase